MKGGGPPTLELPRLDPWNGEVVTIRYTEEKYDGAPGGPDIVQCLLTGRSMSFSIE